MSYSCHRHACLQLHGGTLHCHALPAVRHPPEAGHGALRLLGRRLWRDRHRHRAGPGRVTGYRAKTRFAKFYNLPELITLFKECADIQTSDMLDLPVPEAEYINEVLKPSEEQKELVSTFADRAEAVRAGKVQPTEDNMLKITNDGRKCALDQRLINPLLPDDPESKVNRCVENMFRIWKDTEKDRSTQLCFCDLSTPKGDGSFNVYDDIREKLVAKGIPKEEVAFIHEANTETRKEELFAKVRSGQVRILMGSTPKLGAGTNVQDRLITLHHLDCPWKPSDLEQQGKAGSFARETGTPGSRSPPLCHGSKL